MEAQTPVGERVHAPPVLPPEPQPEIIEGWLKREVLIKNMYDNEYVFDSDLFNIIYLTTRQPAWKGLFIGLMDEFISLYIQEVSLINLDKQIFTLQTDRIKKIPLLEILISVHPKIIGNINGKENPNIKDIINDLLQLSSYEGDEIQLIYKDDSFQWDASRMFQMVSYIYRTVLEQMDPEEWQRMYDGGAARLKPKKLKKSKKRKKKSSKKKKKKSSKKKKKNKY
jgi:hypothetical protein